MSALAALLAQVAAPAVPPPAPDTWPALPALEFQRPGGMADLSAFVRAEVEAGRCAAATVDAAGVSTVRAPVIILVGAEGDVRSVVPASIGCSTVEQYAAGVVGRLAVGNVRRPWPVVPRWFRTGLVFRWARSEAP